MSFQTSTTRPSITTTTTSTNSMVKFTKWRLYRPKTPARIIDDYTFLALLNLILLTRTVINIADITAPLLSYSSLHIQPSPNGTCNGHATLCNRRYSNVT